MDVNALSEPMRRGLARAPADGPQIMKWKVKYRGTPYPTRWNNLRPGTYGVDYFDRAAGALEGLFVHDRDEAEYFSSYEDGEGALLDGANHYLLHFDADQIPPTLPNGFWSITMYGSDFQLVKNPIDRFSIGDSVANAQLRVTRGDRPGGMSAAWRRSSMRAGWVLRPTGHSSRPAVREELAGREHRVVEVRRHNQAGFNWC